MSKSQITDAVRSIGHGDEADSEGVGPGAWGQLLQAARITAAEQDMDLRYVAVLDQPDGPDLSGIIGLLDSDIYDSALATRLEAIKRGAIQSGRPRQGRVDLEQDGGRRTYELTATPRRNERGEIIGVLSIAVEVTHVLQAQEQPRPQPDRLQAQLLQAQKLEGIGRLAGGVAHDFNNLLTVILGYCELLRMRQRPGMELDEIGNAARRASHLTRQLLAFSRRQVFQAETVDLNGLIRGLNRMLRRIIGEDVVLTTALADDALWIVADVGQIEQVLLNLVVNARDAMPSGGTLHIATRIVAPGDEAADNPLPRAVELTVQDSGVGLAEDVRTRIFEPFFTTNGDAARGLGLATVYGIVTQTGGHVECESATGQGTRFRIALPLAQAPDQPAPDPSLTRRAADGRETVLLVEAEAPVREVAARALREYGYDVLEAHDVDSALRHVEHPNVAIVVSDVILPGRSASDPSTETGLRRPHLPVLLTAGSSEALLQRPVDPARLLRKPFTPTDLIAKIRGLLDYRPAPPA